MSSLVRLCCFALGMTACIDFDRFAEANGGGPISNGGQTAADGGGAGTGEGAFGGAPVGGSAAGGDGGAAAAVPLDCREIKLADTGARDGDYLIDPDGPSGAAPFTVRCDMTIDGGGWTRFNWLLDRYPTGSDPLARPLEDCNVSADACAGRIPSPANPTHLLVKDLTDNEHAAWEFDGSVVSNAMLAAFRDKVPVCAEGPAFDPYLDTSTELFCNSLGGCDNFKYTDSGCNGTNAWVLTLDDDSHYCAAAFKLGATTGGPGCGPVDWAFLDDCDCTDESGELYFR